MSALSELDQYFLYKCEEGLKRRGLWDEPGYRSRLDYEVKAILSMGFPGYFLIVQDFITWAKKNNILVGPGRGSAAGSLVAFSLGITELDPIAWDLLFERFLNPGRVSMPDIDVDFEHSRRNEVLDYVTNKYGSDRVAHIGTFGKMRAKAAVRAVCKTLGLPYTVGDEVAKLLLAPIHGKPQPLSVSIEKVERLQQLCKATTPEGEVVRRSQEVENLISSVGVHASGIVISNESLLGKIPMFLGRGGELTTQWEMYNIEEAGYIKFDFLGLDALTKIHGAIDLIKERHGIEIDINKINLQDEAVFANLRAGDTVGIFQLEASSGIKELMVNIRPNSIEDLIALVAIYRPGPLESEYMQTYLDVRAGRANPRYLVAELEPILGKTNGWLIYQEQIMEICKQLCGYSGSEADDMRKAVGKKKEDLMAKHEAKFKSGWDKHGLDPSKGEQMWRDIVAFAAYGFNRSHAAAYAFITYQTAWLKTHYPHEYMCSVMRCIADNKDDVIKCIDECKRLGIKILPPDANTSDLSFTVTDDDTIRFGLGPIRGIKTAAEQILEERKKNGIFTDLKDFCQRIDPSSVNSAKMAALIKSGAFDKFGYSRRALMQAVEEIWDYNKKIKAHNKKLETYVKKMKEYQDRQSEIVAGILSPQGKALKPKTLPTAPECPQWPETQDLDEYSDLEIQQDEHQLLGFFVTSHPLEKWAKAFKGTPTIAQLKEMDAGTPTFTIGVVTSKEEITTSNKRKMAFLRLEDLTGSIEAVIFPQVYPRIISLIESVRPLRVEGTIDVTEADEGRISKIKVRDIVPLNLEVKSRDPEKLQVNVPISRAHELQDLMVKYKGDSNEVLITLEASRGSLRLPAKIGDYKDALMKDISGLK